MRFFIFIFGFALLRILSFLCFRLCKLIYVESPILTYFPLFFTITLSLETLNAETRILQVSAYSFESIQIHNVILKSLNQKISKSDLILPNPRFLVIIQYLLGSYGFIWECRELQIAHGLFDDILSALPRLRRWEH